MNSNHWPAFFAGVVVWLVAAPLYAWSQIQLSSSENQMGQMGGVARKLVTFNNENAFGGGIKHDNGSITFTEAGTYFVIATARAGSSDGKGRGDVSLWLRLNHQDLPNSIRHQAILHGSTAMLVSQRVVEVESGDKLELAFSLREWNWPEEQFGKNLFGEKLGLIASKPKREPSVPSVTFTAFRFESTKYAQFCSTDSQPAEMAGQRVTLNQTDATQEIENVKGVVTFKAAGTYFVMAVAQVGATNKSRGPIHLWMQHNGVEIAGSNAERDASVWTYGALVTQVVVECKGGDTLELVQSSDHTVGLEASSWEDGLVAPSVTLSIMQLDDNCHAQLSSHDSQPARFEGKALTLDQIAATKEVENDNGTMTIQQAGTYFVCAVGQCGIAKGNGTGYVRMWLRQNANDVDNSSTEQTIDFRSSTGQICQGIRVFNAGEKFQLVQSGKGSSAGMIASRPTDAPAIPSVKVSLFKID